MLRNVFFRFSYRSAHLTYKWLRISLMSALLFMFQLHEASGRQAPVIAGGLALGSAGEAMVGCWGRGHENTHPVAAALRHDSTTTNMNPRWPPGAVSAARTPPLSPTSPLFGEWWYVLPCCHRWRSSYDHPQCSRRPRRGNTLHPGDFNASRYHSHHGGSHHLDQCPHHSYLLQLSR